MEGVKVALGELIDLLIETKEAGGTLKCSADLPRFGFLCSGCFYFKGFHDSRVCG